MARVPVTVAKRINRIVFKKTDGLISSNIELKLNYSLYLLCDEDTVSLMGFFDIAGFYELKVIGTIRASLLFK